MSAMRYDRRTHPKARAHFKTLTAAGWTLRATAAHAGIAASDLSRFRQGADLPHVATALLRVDPAALPTRTTGTGAEPFVSRTGTERRIRALLFMGWTHADLQQRTGIRTGLILSQPGRWVTRSTHDRIAKVYRELSTVPGPSDRTRARARKLGYAGPGAWDDIDRDPEPEPEPTEPFTLAATDPERRAHERRAEDYAHLIANGVPHAEALARIGWTPAEGPTSVARIVKTARRWTEAAA